MLRTGKIIKYKNKEILSFLLILSWLVSGNYSWGYIYGYIIACIFLVGIKFRLNTKLFKTIFKYYLVPNAFIFLHAIASTMVYGQSFYMPRALNNLILSTCTIFFAYALYRLHGLNSLRIIAADIIVLYIIRVFEAIFHVGLTTFIKYVFVPGSPELSHWLELNDVGLALGILVLYYIFYCKDQKVRFRTLFLLCVVFVLCFKRIALGAFIVTSMYILIFNRILDKKNKMMTIWGIIGVVVCLGIVYLMTDNILTNWMWAHGINVMGRDNLYRFFRSYYNFSPFFFGRGSGFTGKLLTSGVNVIEGTINTAAALHSDILRVFIEYGFIGSILWYAYYLVFLPNKFKKVNFCFGEVAFACTLYAFIVYITDNSTYYALFQVLLILVPLGAMDTSVKSTTHFNEKISAGDTK